MITNKTVLILGAGASMPYGFPSAYDMKSQIAYRLCNEVGFQKQIAEIVSEVNREQQKPTEYYAIIGKAMKRSTLPSVDIFFENRKNDFDVLVGKAITALHLIALENEEELFVNYEKGDHPAQRGKYSSRWYDNLFTLIGSSYEDFLNSDLKIITFNYDRSLEFSLYHHLVNSFGADESMVSEIVKKFEILHFYGSLGIPGFVGLDHQMSRNYSTNVKNPEIIKAIKNIRLIGEDRDSEENIAIAARSFIRDAEVLCFFGFGYQDLNIKRLIDDQNLENKRHIYGTAYGLGEGQVATTKILLRKLYRSTSHLDKFHFINLKNKEFIHSYSDIFFTKKEIPNSRNIKYEIP